MASHIGAPGGNFEKFSGIAYGNETVCRKCMTHEETMNAIRVLLINCQMMKLSQKSTLAAGAITKSSLPKVSLDQKSEGRLDEFTP